ncbi:hypothetical protein SDC9_144086 [bioreactor metagenome]|uniref:Uncharacterized protein n=2 Tax=root TaxID=1 RepID=A0A1W1IGA6_9LACT|nr:hypothetical protein SAMN04488086_11157 [Trichococcus pasteurii]SLM52055.1 Hypothetical protein TPAS_1736 [Trichococcus pasteurii]SSB92936.1 Hypothetical protein TPAS_1736 [Trichococcus pasteurii]
MSPRPDLTSPSAPNRIIVLHFYWSFFQNITAVWTSSCPQTDLDDVKFISQNSNHFRIKGNYYYSHWSTAVSATIPQKFHVEHLLLHLQNLLQPCIIFLPQLMFHVELFRQCLFFGLIPSVNLSPASICFSIYLLF